VTPVLPSNPNLALVTLRGSGCVFVRDITDITHPRTVGDLGIAYPTSDGGNTWQTPLVPDFVSVTEVSYASDNGLLRTPLRGAPKTLVIKHAYAGSWSPDGKAVVFMTSTSTDAYSGTIYIHQFRAGHDQVLGSMPNGGGGGCETIQGCSLPNWLDSQLSYSPDGTVISLVVNTFSGSYFRLWSSAGKLLKSNDGQGATMSTWSGGGLYFRDANGVEVWRKGVISLFLPGVAWVKPKGSSDGTQIVFTVRDSSGWGHIRVVDTTTKQVRELKSARTDAVFLTPRFVWYEGERACVADENCGADPPYHPLNDKTYIYDLQTGTETESIITSVSDVWPHPA
jgi:WD40-like Beta Propeller Repeat